MISTRRGFLAGILSAAAAPMIVRVGSLMPISSRIATPPWMHAFADQAGDDLGGFLVPEEFRLALDRIFASECRAIKRRFEIAVFGEDRHIR